MRARAPLFPSVASSLLILIPEPMHEAGVQMLSARFDVTYDPALTGDQERLDELIAEAVALIVRHGTQVDERRLELAPKLRVVARLDVGLDNIDLDACSKRGITVVPATGANTQSVAEHVIAVAMVLLRPSIFGGPQARRGQWPKRRPHLDRELSGKTLGLVGFGAIGQRTAQLARALAMDVVAYDATLSELAPPWREIGVRRATFDEVLASADVLSLHVPLLPSTRNLMDTRRIAQMKSGAVLINSARAGIVNERALIDALRSGHLGGASLDAFEPHQGLSPWRFDSVPNLLLTPHAAGVTAESEHRASALIAERVSVFLDYLAKAEE